jgi:anti-sigma regulatory factor (Ser/Thr protein kinase)
VAVDQAAHDAPRSRIDVDGWAADAFGLLGGLPAVGRVGLALVEGGGRRLLFTASDRLRASDLGWCHIDAYDDVPLNAAVRHAAPVIGALDGLPEQYGSFVAAQRGTPYVAVAAIPITASGGVLGGFVLFFDQPQRFDVHQRAELARLGDRLGNRLGSALRRAQVRRRRRPAATDSRAVVPPGALVAVHEVPAEPAAVGEARRFFQETLDAWGVDRDRADTATLCLSELVTNAVIHSHGGCVVRVVLHDGAVTVWVRDSGIADAVPLEPSGDPLEVHGRGLQLVEALASSWGHDADADGASVWFAIDVG